MNINIVQFNPPTVEFIDENWRRTCRVYLRQEIGSRNSRSNQWPTTWRKFKQPNSIWFFEWPTQRRFKPKVTKEPMIRPTLDMVIAEKWQYNIM